MTHLRLLRHSIALLRSVGDRPLAAIAALVVVSGLIPVASIYVTKGVVDRLVAAVSARGESGMASLVLWASAAGALLLLAEIVGSVLSWVRSRHQERLQDQITAKIHEQSARLDLAFYESPAFFDRLHRAKEEARYRPAELCHAFVDVLRGAVTVVGLGAVLISFGPWFPLVLLLGALPVVFVVVIHAFAYRRWRRKTTQDERRAWYYDVALTSAEFASELRAYGWAPRFQDAYRALRARLRNEEMDLAKRRSVAEAGASAASLVVMGAGFAWMVRQAVAGVVSLGGLAAFGQALVTGLATMRSLLSGVGRIYANSLFVEDLTEFLGMQPQIVSTPNFQFATPKVEVRRAPLQGCQAPLQGCQDGRAPFQGRQVAFRDVTFFYPGASNPALRGFNLHIPAGQRAAIVGANGAGKSTLIKLISRLYDPSEGVIEIDGVDIREFELTELRALISPLFQDPVRYFQTVRHNIEMGLPDQLRGFPLEPEEAQKHIRGFRLQAEDPSQLRGFRLQAEEAAAGAGASRLIESLPKGYDTVLGKWFDDGVELSAGEWQRVALARAIARPSPIVVLDEPTSALDPWTEADWYDRFCEATAGRTSVIVTHRFSTAMQADVIHVMERGRIVEWGTHCDLLTLGGRYSRAWAVNHSRESRPAVAAVS